MNLLTDRTALVSRCEFGWEGLAIAAFCVFLDSDNVDSIFLSLRNQSILVVIIRAGIRD